EPRDGRAISPRRTPAPRRGRTRRLPRRRSSVARPVAVGAAIDRHATVEEYVAILAVASAHLLHQQLHASRAPELVDHLDETHRAGQTVAGDDRAEIAKGLLAREDA